MINLSLNPLFWPIQANFVVDKTKPNIFLGCGIATKNQLSQAVPLIADQHAWLANNFDQGKCQKTANNLKLKNWQIFLASHIFPDALPQSYEELEKRDVEHFFNNHHCGIKIGWSFSMAESDHKTDESHFDAKLNLPINILLTKPGVTGNPSKLSTWKVESNNPAVKNHLKRIILLWENLFGPFPNKTPLESKIKQVIEKITC